MRNNKHKNWKLAASAALLTSAIVTPAVVSAATQNFKDVPPTHVAYNSIMYLANKGIISGYSDGTFRPSALVTRGQAAKILASSLNLDLKNVKNPYFRDVPTSHGFYKYIAALHEAGIIDGYSNGNFGVNDPLTRGQMAKILALSYGFEKQPIRTAKFSDVSKDAYYAVYLQSLIDNNITYGVTNTQFAPNRKVDRGQMAMFVHRSELAKVKVDRSGTVEAVIQSFDEYSLMTNKGTFDIPSSLRSFFTWQNLNALKNANITFDEENGVIAYITNLELRNSGSSSNPHILNGDHNVIYGNLFIDADHVYVKDVTVNKNLTIGNDAQTKFQSDNLTVKGTTFINEGLYSISNTNQPTTITFNNTILNNVQVSKNNSTITLSNKSNAQSFSFNTNATLKTTDTSKVNDISFDGLATEATINASVNKLSVSTTKDFTLNGSGNISTFSISTNRLVTINANGTISTLIIPKDGYIHLSAQTYINNAEIPKNTSIKSYIRNYDQVKHRIERINGVKNNDNNPPVVNPPVYPDINILSAVLNSDGVISMSFDQQPTKLMITTKNEIYTNDWMTNRNIEILNLSIANGTYNNGQAGTFAWNEGNKRYSTSYATVSSNGKWKTVTFYNDSRHQDFVYEFTYRVASRSLDISTDDIDDKTLFLQNSTFYIQGTKGSYEAIAGRQISVPVSVPVSSNVANENELQKAIAAKVPTITVTKNITLTKPLVINYPNVRIQTTNNSTITVSNKMSYGENEAAITFSENATNAKWLNVNLIGHGNTRGNGLLNYANNLSIENAEIKGFAGFNIVSNNASSISLNKVKLTNASKAGLQVNTNRNATINLTNNETKDNSFGGIEFNNDWNSSIVLTGSGNVHDDFGRNKQPMPAFYFEGNGTFYPNLDDMKLYTKAGNAYYHVDNEAEFNTAYDELSKNETNPILNIAGNFTATTPMNISQPLIVKGNGKTITLNAKGNTSKAAQGLWINSTVAIENLNFTAGKDMKDHIITVNGNGASLALSNATLSDSTLAAIYVGNDSNKETKLTLKDNISFINNVKGGVGAKNGVTIDATKANISIKGSPNIFYRDENLRKEDSFTADPIFFDDTLDVTFELPNEYEKYVVYRKVNVGNKKNQTYKQIIYIYS